jgi:hypothetical protein
MSDLVQTSAAPDGLRFTIGRTLSLSFGVLGRNIGPMALIAITITAIQSAIDYILTGDATGGESSASSILAVVTYGLITAPVTYATFQDLRGAKVSMGELFSRGFSRAGRVVAASFAFGVVLAVPIGVVAMIGGIAGVPGFVLIAAGSIFALFIFVRWFILVPVQVMEVGGVGRGFTRAAELGRGRRWTLLALMLVYLVMVAGIMFAMAAIGYLAPDSPIVAGAMFVPVAAFSSVMGAILPATVYYLLRAEKEGVGIDEIARVFD